MKPYLTVMKEQLIPIGFNFSQSVLRYTQYFPFMFYNRLFEIISLSRTDPSRDELLSHTTIKVLEALSSPQTVGKCVWSGHQLSPTLQVEDHGMHVPSAHWNSEHGFSKRLNHIIWSEKIHFPIFFSRQFRCKGYSWFSHDVTKIRTTKLLIFLRFYFNDV